MKGSTQKQMPKNAQMPRQKTLDHVTKSEIQKNTSEFGNKRSASIIEQDEAAAMLEKQMPQGGSLDRFGLPRQNKGGRP